MTKNQGVKFNSEGITVRNVASGMMECIQNAKVSKLVFFTFRVFFNKDMGTIAWGV